MEISQIVIENRPRLQCANFFIQFSDMFASQDAVKLNVRPDTLHIIIESDRNYEINLKPFFQLHTRTLSQLVIKKNFISFRINTNESEFSTEILRVTEVNANNSNFKLSPAFHAQESVDIKCSNCENTFLSKQNFSRILELPSDNFDMSDWFCHKPHDLNHVFSPKFEEVFYGSFYFLVNPQTFKGTRYKGTLTYCRRCLQFIGELIGDPKKKDSIKLWNDCVTLNNEHFFTNDLVQNFNFILQKLQHDFTVDLPGLPQLLKVIFEAKLSSGKQNYLLLQVMDHKLEILRNTTDLGLQKCTVTKLLYKFEQDRDNPMVKFWLGNTNINTIQISPKMFQIAAEYLGNMSKLIAECYRTSQGFTLSYLNL